MQEEPHIAGKVDGGSLLAGALCGAIGFLVAVPAGFIGILVVAILGVIVGNLIGKAKVPYKIKGSTNYGQFPRIKELRSQRWKNGLKPSQVEQNSAPTA